MLYGDEPRETDRGAPPDPPQQATPGMSHSPNQTGTGLKRACDQAIAACGGHARGAVNALIGANEFWNQKSANCPHQKLCAASVAVYALAPIVGLNTRPPRTSRAKAVLISRERIRWFRAKGIGIPNCFARVRFVVSAEVFARRGGICHRRDNQSRAKQAKDRGSHYGSEN
jgi:hypothetical protein